MAGDHAPLVIRSLITPTRYSSIDGRCARLAAYTLRLAADRPHIIRVVFCTNSKDIKKSKVQRSRTCVEAEGHAGPEEREAKERREGQRQRGARAADGIAQQRGLAVGESFIK